MSSKSLVICDQEEKYASAFAAYLTKKKELALQVQVCSDPGQARKIQQEKAIDILLISSGYSQEMRKEIQAGSVFVLTETASASTGPLEIPVYRYQSGEAILAEVICQCGLKGEEEGLFLQAAKKRQMRIIGIFSPVHRTGKTGYGLEMGKELAVSYNVLYINMELYGGIGGHFPKEGQTLADLIYYSRQESRNFGMILTTLAKHMESLDYLLPFRVSEDIKAVTPEEWTSLLMQIEQCAIYDVLILDIDEGIQDVYGVLRQCTEVMVPVARDPAARAKLFQFEEELRLLGYEDVKKKLVKKELER